MLARFWPWNAVVAVYWAGEMWTSKFKKSLGWLLVGFDKRMVTEALNGESSPERVRSVIVVKKVQTSLVETSQKSWWGSGSGFSGVLENVEG